MMSDKTEPDTRRRSAADRAETDGAPQQHRQVPAGMDLPIFGHVPYTSLGVLAGLGFLAGLGVVGAAGVIEWPVAAAVGIGYVLARR